MPLTLTCSCGKTLSVPDHLLGKKVKCSHCKSILLAKNPDLPDEIALPEAMPLKAADFEPAPVKPPPSSIAPETKAAPRKAVPKAAASFPTGRRKSTEPVKEPRIHLSPGMIALVAAIIIIPTVLFLIKSYPMHTNDVWSARETENENAVIDMVTVSIQHQMAKEGMFDPKDPRHSPHATDCKFFWTTMVWSMPEKVGFAGHSTVGDFRGRIYPKDWHIEAEMELGSKSMNMIGQIKDGSVHSIELNGQKIR